MKVLCVIYSIDGGGAEKQMQYLLGSFDRSKIQPCLAVCRLTGREQDVVPEDVPIYDLSTPLRPATVFMVLKLIKLFKELRPERVLSFMWSVNTITMLALILSGVRVPVIISERTHLGRSILRYPLISLRRFFIRMLYPVADKVVAVSVSVAGNLIDEYNVPPSRITVIPNGTPVSRIEEKKAEPAESICRKPYIVCAGGLNPTKNYSLLIRAFARMGTVNSSLNLLILGEGEERAALEDLSGTLKVKDRVFMPGALANPYPFIGGAEVLVLSSRFEGFPNVILEAMASRVPVIATLCSSAVAELIENGKTGVIITDNDEEMLVKELERLLARPELRLSMSEKAYQKVRSEFDLNTMVKKYEHILQ